MYRVYFTNWELSVADEIVRFECETEQEAWNWVDAHEWELGAEEAFEVREVSED